MNKYLVVFMNGDSDENILSLYFIINRLMETYAYSGWTDGTKSLSIFDTNLDIDVLMINCLVTEQLMQLMSSRSIPIMYLGNNKAVDNIKYCNLLNLNTVVNIGNIPLVNLSIAYATYLLEKSIRGGSLYPLEVVSDDIRDNQRSVKNLINLNVNESTFISGINGNFLMQLINKNPLEITNMDNVRNLVTMKKVYFNE